jgi:hypothetical protein
MKSMFLSNSLFFILLIQVLFFSCQSPATKKVEHPSTPEAVVLLWQAYIDNNQFSEAESLSQGQALTYINELQEYTVLDSMETENNIMLNLKCQVVGDSAYCTYHFADELGESEPGQLALQKIKGRWYVHKTDFEADAPSEQNQIQTDSLDEELE